MPKNTIENKTIDTQNLPVIALVGRVNVGKSTLFNKLTEENKAIISKIPWYNSHQQRRFNYLARQVHKIN